MTTNLGSTTAQVSSSESLLPHVDTGSVLPHWAAVRIKQGGGYTVLLSHLKYTGLDDWEVLSLLLH
jgi:hypothetical protein